MGSEQLFQIAMVALGGAIGAVLRYGVSLAAPSEPISWSTFIANFIGCFLICFIFFKFLDMSETTRLLLFVGFFGAFTTMSSVSLEMIQFSSNSMLGMTFVVFAMNAVVCIFAGFLGRGLAVMT